MDACDARKVLGLGERFTASELRRAYRSAAKRYHPDVAARSGAEADAANAMMARANEAHRVLEDLAEAEPTSAALLLVVEMEPGARDEAGLEESVVEDTCSFRWGSAIAALVRVLPLRLPFLFASCWLVYETSGVNLLETMGFCPPGWEASSVDPLASSVAILSFVAASFNLLVPFVTDPLRALILRRIG